MCLVKVVSLWHLCSFRPRGDRLSGGLRAERGGEEVTRKDWFCVFNRLLEGKESAADVLRYFRELGAAEDVPESLFAGFVCAYGKIDRPSAAERRDLTYFMFQAAYEGCLESVKAYISVKHVNVQNMLQNCCFTVLD